jgi:aerobic carbon-monoxide dehydrogenase medium subunit
VKPSEFIYHRPSAIEEALDLLGEFGDEGKVLAGGQSLVPLLALRLARPEHVIDIGRIASLAAITDGEGGLLVGALARHSDVEDSPVVRRAQPLVATAMPYIGHRAIRNRGTACGSIAHADPAAELPAVALAAGAEMIVRSRGGERTVAAADFFLGYLSADVNSDEVLTGVRWPVWPSSVGWSVQEVTRRHADYALIGLAAWLDVDGAGRVAAAALSFFGAASTPVRVREAEDLLVGEPPTVELFAEAASVVTRSLDPPDDNHASAAYRAHVAGVLTRRCLAEAHTRVREAS